jgi:hypothetical protein
MSNKYLMDLESTFNFLEHHEFFDDARGFEGKGACSRLVCFGANRVNTFQGLRSIIIVQIQHGYSPFVISVHCMAH